MIDRHFLWPASSGSAVDQWKSRMANPHGLEELSPFNQDGRTFQSGGRDRTENHPWNCVSLLPQDSQQHQGC